MQISTLRKAGAAWLAVTVALASGAGGASAQSTTLYPEAAGKALTWMKTQQQPDGSFAGFGAGSTVDAVLAIMSGGMDPASYSTGGNTPVSFLQSKVADLAKTPGGAGKLLLITRAMRAEPASFGSVNLLDSINTSYDQATGQYGKDAIGHAFAMLGLVAAGETVPENAMVRLESLQTVDGGWAFSGETGAGAADTNTTAVAVQALRAVGVGVNNPTLQKALAYLLSQQGADGGFPYQKGGEFGSESDVNSTAYVAQALIALEADASRPLQFIVSIQKPNGAFQWKPSEKDDNAGATYQAIPALLGITLIAPNAPGLQGGPTVQPGMPRTGEGDALPVAVIALAGIAVGAGIITRRRAA